MSRPPMHPCATDPVASRYCPDCGELGFRVRALEPHLEEWACPRCDPDEVPDSEVPS